MAEIIDANVGSVTPSIKATPVYLVTAQRIDSAGDKVDVPPGQVRVGVASIFWGVFLGNAAFAFAAWLLYELSRL